MSANICRSAHFSTPYRKSGAVLHNCASFGPTVINYEENRRFIDEQAMKSALGRCWGCEVPQRLGGVRGCGVGPPRAGHGTKGLGGEWGGAREPHGGQRTPTPTAQPWTGGAPDR